MVCERICLASASMRMSRTRFMIYGKKLILSKNNSSTTNSSLGPRSFSTTNNTNNPNGTPTSTTNKPSAARVSSSTISTTHEENTARAKTTATNKFQMHQQNSKPIPVLDVSPYLDPVTFCKNSSTYESSSTSKLRTIDGTLAAKRLNRGKQIVRDLLTYQLCSYYHPEKKREETNKQQQSNKDYILANLRQNKQQQGRRRRWMNANSSTRHNPQPFILSGHGIPKQLLKDHLQLCYQVVLHLQQEQIMTGGECFFHHSSSATNKSYDNDNTTILHVRNEGGKNKVISWPFVFNTTNGNLFQDRLLLYLTVMNRISSNLVRMLTTTGNTADETTTPSYWNVHFCVNHQKNDYSATDPYYYHYYNDNKEQQQPSMSNNDEPLLIAQLSVRSNNTITSSSTTSTNVRIQMHGMMNDEEKQFDDTKDNESTTSSNRRVSMVYEACFYFNN